MKLSAIVFLMAAVAGSASAQEKHHAEAQKPLVLASQGSFFVGGESKTISAPGLGPNAPMVSGEVTINQMYVQYQIPPAGSRHVPVVMVHGCCLSSKTWETTPDGRMGWNEYFVRKNRSVYLADQVSRARSGFDASKMIAVKAGKLPPVTSPIFCLPRTRRLGPFSGSGPASTSRSRMNSFR